MKSAKGRVPRQEREGECKQGPMGLEIAKGLEIANAPLWWLAGVPRIAGAPVMAVRGRQALPRTLPAVRHREPGARGIIGAEAAPDGYNAELIRLTNLRIE